MSDIHISGRVKSMAYRDMETGEARIIVDYPYIGAYGLIPKLEKAGIAPNTRITVAQSLDDIRFGHVDEGSLMSVTGLANAAPPEDDTPEVVWA